MFRFSILIQVTEPANVERDFCKERKGRKRLLPFTMGSVGKGNTKFRVFFFFRTIFSFNCYYCMHLIVYDFKSSNVDIFFFHLRRCG